MTIHPHFRRMHHLLYRADSGAIIGHEALPSSGLPIGWGALSVPDEGSIPTGKTHRIDVSADPHALVALTADERAAANMPSAPEVVARVAQELASTDQFMMTDRPMHTDVRAAWTAYRQALRDLSKLDPARGRVRTPLEMIQDWPGRPDGGDPIPNFRSRI